MIEKPETEAERVRKRVVTPIDGCGPRTRSRVLLAALAVLMCLGGHARIATAQSRERLVPAVFAIKTDSQGQRWDVRNYGQIGTGTNNAFDSAMTMQVGRSSFRPQSTMMTPDGNEYVLSGVSSNLRITRRIKVDAQAAAVRYVEILTNPTQAKINVMLTFNTQLVRGQSPSVITDQGAPAGASLGKEDSGILVFGNASNSQVSLLFHLAGARSRIKPSIQNQSNQRFSFVYTVSVPAGKTVSILHGIAQRNLPSVPNSRVAGDLFKVFADREWTRDLAPEIRRSIINLGPRRFSEDVVSTISLEALGVEREASNDILAIGDETRLPGTASCGGVTLETSYGPLRLPLEQVAAIAGPRFTGGRSKVFLIDGQVYQGDLTLDNLRFVLTSGLEFQVATEDLDRLLMRVGAGDGAADESVDAMLETTGGDRIALLRGPEQSVDATTPWGRRSIRLEEIQRMFMAEQRVGHHLVLRDGSRLFAFLTGAALTLKTQYFAEQAFRASQIQRLTDARAVIDEEVQPELAVPHVKLAGENLIVGQIDLPAVHFVTKGHRIPVPPNQIRLIRNVGPAEDVASAGGVFLEAELWDGGTVRGSLAELVLPIRCADSVARVPVQDVMEVHMPTPAVTDAMRERIVLLIEDLGHADYAKRKAARRALSELGHLPKIQLHETLRQTSDPEVRRSVETLLADLEE